MSAEFWMRKYNRTNLGNDVAILGVHTRQSADAAAVLEASEHLVVAYHHHVLVRHEELERVDA